MKLRTALQRCIYAEHKRLGLYESRCKFCIYNLYSAVRDYEDIVYGKPYCRISPYLIGIVLGFVLHNTQKNEQMSGSTGNMEKKSDHVSLHKYFQVTQL